VQSSSGIFRRIAVFKGSCAGQRIAKQVCVARADDLPASLDENLVEAVHPIEDAAGLQDSDGFIDGIPAASRLLGDGFVTRKAVAGAVVVELPKHGLQHSEKSPGDRALVLSFAAVLRVIAARVGHDAHLGLSVERNARLLAEEFFAARAR